MEDDPPPPGRRDFLTLATISTASVGGLVALWPLLEAVTPETEDHPAPDFVDVPTAKMLPQQPVAVRWNSLPVFIIKRSAEALSALQDQALSAQLKDPLSEVAQQPGYARNWHRSLAPEFAVLVGICTHLGCIPSYKPARPGAHKKCGEYGCACHGSRFDLAGRVLKGGPAPYNLPVPPHVFLKDGVLRIGQNPPGHQFDFSSIKQL